MLSKSKLLERGWTHSLINSFLPLPDATRENPHYPSAPKMKLYRADRVEEVENSDEFKQARAKSDRRKVTAKKVVSVKFAKTMEQVEQFEDIHVPVVPKAKLIKLACDKYGSPGDCLDLAYVRRICFTYVLRQLVPYHGYRADVSKRIGTGLARQILRDKVFDAIARVYPWLSEECESRKLEHAEGEPDWVARWAEHMAPVPA